MKSKTLALIFGISYALLINSAFSQQTTAPLPEKQSSEGAQRDDRQDTASVTRDAGQDTAAALSLSKQEVANAIMEAQVKANQDTLEMMTARNAFWIQVLQTIMPIMSAIGIAVVGWLQIKAARERSLMAQSINGMKTELVAVTRAAAFYEGAHTEAEKNKPGDTPSLTAQRGMELSDEARAASVEAHRVAALAAGEKPSKKAAAVMTPVDAINLAPGETASAEAMRGGGTMVTKDTP